MRYKFFVTGTDTNVGKTFITIGLLNKFKALGFSSIAMKPVASGGFYQQGKIYNDDALKLQQSSSTALDYDIINPFCFLPAISPNIAANYCDTLLSVANISTRISDFMSNQADICIIEGIGGWYTPLNDKETMADLVKKCDLPVILVLGLKLGCLNHAILTYRAMLNEEVTIKGWVVNCIDPFMEAQLENIKTIQKYIKSPCLGVIKYNQNPAEIINVGPLLY